jgi:hypothetical protein
MKRLNFIKQFNSEFQDISPKVVRLSQYTDTHNSIVRFWFTDHTNIFQDKNLPEIKQHILNEIFEKLFINLKLIKLNVLDQLTTEIEECFDLYEDNDKYEKENLNAYEIKFNLNELYDLLHGDLNADLHKNHSNHKIYRLIISSQEGVFNGIGLTILKHNIFSDSPEKDPVISSIFFENQDAFQKSYSKKWFFGFKKKEDIHKWFPEHKQQEKLESHQCIIEEYEVESPYYLEGRNQAIFIKNKAELISSKPYLQKEIETLLKNKKSAKHKLKIS